MSVYRPKRLKVDSLGIGLSNVTNDNLALDPSSQHLIVGESWTTSGGIARPSYGLIVDRDGVAINSTLPDRARLADEFALFVDGNVFVRGNLVACNVRGSSNGTGGSDFWQAAIGDGDLVDRDNIYYPGKITVGTRGNYNSAANNTHALNVVESADVTIDHAQLSVQNTALSQLRMGIIGRAADSPAIVNTVPGVPLEFHAGRDQSAFSNVYRELVYIDGNPQYVTTETPHYTSRDDAPHLRIDPSGAVGIHCPTVPSITYTGVNFVNTNAGAVFPQVTEIPPLYVNGTAFASNVVIYDPQTNCNADLYDMFVRRAGVTLLANQIIPGPFANGTYVFPDALAINGAASNNFQLTVNGAERVSEYLQVDGRTSLNMVEINDAVLLDVASFCNDVYINRDIIVKESIRLRGGMFVEVPSGPSSTAWCNVQFTVAGYEYSNINLIGTGIATPGRLGTGISPNVDEVNNQFVIRKRTRDIYEMELMDKSDDKLYKTAFIGHPPTDGMRVNDGSLVIATPPSGDPNYNFGYPNGAPQNIYFYPGASFATRTEPIVTSSNPPTLNIHHTRRVGILTYDPITTLDVRGDIALTGNLYRLTSNTVTIDADTPIVGLWTERTYRSVVTQEGPMPTFRGIEYVNTATSNMGIHVIPDPRYGVRVAGGFQSINGIYTPDHRKTIQWISSANASNINPASAAYTSESMFTVHNVGIGVSQTSANLEICNPRSGPTSMRLIRGVNNFETRIDMGNTDRPWTLRAYADSGRDRMEIARSNVPVLWCTRDDILGRNRVVISSNLEIYNHASNTAPDAALTVDGDVSVVGNMHVSGRYFANGQVIINEAAFGSNNTYTAASPDDVFIGGGHIFVNPGANKYFGINYTGLTTYAEEINSKAPFRIYQGDTSTPIVARMRAQNDNALIELVNRSRVTARFGLYNNAFSFLDATNSPFFSFQSNEQLGEKYFVFNQSESPTATFHVQNRTTGRNMVRLTRYGEGADISGAAPELDFEKTIRAGGVSRTTGWTLRGPDATYQQKLGLVYRDVAGPDLVSQTGTSNEMFTFTRDGCLGIGNSMPEFGVDIVGTGKRGSIRMLNTSADPTPQLIFQSGSNLYGVDALTDFTMYSSSNNFYLDMETSRIYQRLMHFDDAGRLGLNAAADPRYNVNIGGDLNVSRTIYLDGNPVATVESEQAQEGFALRAVNIYMRPDPLRYGGLHVNTGVITSNLFDVYGETNENLATWASPFIEGNQNFRVRVPNTSQYNIGRLAFSNDTFRMSWQPNSGPDYYIPGCNLGYSPIFEASVSNAAFYASNLSLPSGRITSTQDGLGIYGAKSAIAVGTVANSNYALAVHASNVNIAALRLSLAAPAAAADYLLAGPTASEFRLDCNMNLSTTGAVTAVGGLVAPSLSNATMQFLCPAGESMRISPTGNVGIGTTNTVAAILTVTAPAPTSNALAITGKVTVAGDIVPAADGIYSLGTPAARWKDLAISGQTIDMSGTLITQTVTGDIKLLSSNTNTLKTIVVDALQLGDEAYSSIITLRPSPQSLTAPFIFSALDPQTQQQTDYEPLFRSSATGGIAINVQNPEAALHVLQFLPTPVAIFDGRNADAPMLMDVRTGPSSSVFKVTRTGVEINGSASFNGPANSNIDLKCLTLTADEAIVTGSVSITSNLNVTGDIYNNGTLVTSSDIRLKTDLRRIDNALDRLSTLTGYTYTKDGRRETGLIAQEVATALPEAVYGRDFMSVAYGNMMGLVVEAIKEIKQEVAELRKMITDKQ